jgi:biotin carboxylase
MKRVLLVAAKTGYQVREFAGAAQKLGVELVLATDRCDVLDNPWGDDAAPVQFASPAKGIEALAARGPFDGILAVGDEPADVAAQAAERLGLRYHSADSTLAAKNKYLARRRFREANLLVPPFEAVPLASDPAVAAREIGKSVRYPCVLKPVGLSGSRGVIRANGPGEFIRAFDRIARIVGGKRGALSASDAVILVEHFIPGLELALEGVVTAGRLTTLALFDKPDPLDGPFFEETIYVTPSRQPIAMRKAIRAAAQRAVEALGLSDGPVHAEMRVNPSGVWMLETAARPIGGLCSRVLRFTLHRKRLGLEELLLRHALGEDVSAARLARGAHAVMMIPIPKAGVFQGAEGVEKARSIRGIEDVVITAKPGQMLEPLPEGASYLGFIFARASSPGFAEAALRRAHGRLNFLLSAALPVVR